MKAQKNTGATAECYKGSMGRNGADFRELIDKSMSFT